MQATAQVLENEDDFYSVEKACNAVERYDNHTDPTLEGQHKPELTREDDLGIAMALCPQANVPKLVEIKPCRGSSKDIQKTAMELAHMVWEAKQANDVSALEAACALIREFLLDHRVCFTVD